MALELRFTKTGKEIKAAIAGRRTQLKARLEKRNGELDAFMHNPKKLRSYLIRSTEHKWGHGRSGAATLYAKDDISSEEKQEIGQLCRRIYEIEQELHRLLLITSHLRDDQKFDLPFEDLVAYGFEANLEVDE